METIIHVYCHLEVPFYNQPNAPVPDSFIHLSYFKCIISFVSKEKKQGRNKKMKEVNRNENVLTYTPPTIMIT